MLKSYLGLQQDALDAMGKERQRLREVAQREERRALKLQEVIETMHPGAASFHPLLWQNKQQMQGQLRHLLAHQQQQCALASQDLAHHEGQLIRQFGRVKGLELLLDKRALAARQRQESGEQRQLDELAALRHRALQGK
ncbi:lateral flagellar protein LfiJ [Aeromonas sanarellii]|uniref:lateral flagellar protein LfiJ n=1 Tax=Aeromonas TaxID=642 RepID=UPI001C2404AF|nr:MULTISPECIES: lateral flagellar protein LfiJ [unclassified Aeromonas]QXC30929.1 lateral flagellar protein LfiJ [Aeromonas sp. FDAARGOS 1409]WOX48802.1 lateral flagellar protein LfiJ [Aeromonas sp. XH]